MKLSLFNSLTRKREPFVPINANLVKMYVCGPTVYDHPHIGNARSAVVFDILYRILRKIYGKDQVRYVRNITDIDDKIIDRAERDNIAISELTQKTTKYFHDNMNFLGCLSPNIEPKATEHVQEMINIIESLLEKNIAYKSGGHVYFDVSKSSTYTKLSGRSLDDMFKGVRIEVSKHKRNSEDFVLWKPFKGEEDKSSCFESPFGLGRPGWHIECSAMSHKYLGETFDIHGGGADLIFPHHTNEIAQSVCAFPGSEYAKTWIHNGFLTVNHEKMSKSLGNFTTVQDLIKQNISGESARLFLMSNHYRKPIDYNDKAIQDADNMLSYWYRAIEEIESDIKPIRIPILFMDALLEDMNTHKAITIINDFAKEVHASKEAVIKLVAANNLVVCARFLGLMHHKVKDWFQSVDNVSEVEKLIKERKQAKQNKEWSKADSIRDKLTEMGVLIEDKPDGSTAWKSK